MLPVLIEFPQLGVAIHSRGLLIVVAALFCNLVGPPWIEALEGIDRGKSRRALLWLLPSAFLGGRLHYMANHWSELAAEPLAAFVLWGRGMHAGGAIALVALAMPVVTGRLGIPLGRFADGAVPAVAIAVAIARVGCFLRGCCYGAASDWPWAVRFPADALAYGGGSALAPGTALHPLQLYFASAALVIAVLALWLRRHRRYEGQIALIALLLHSLSAAAIEPFRSDHPGRVYWGSLPQLEWVALAMVAVAALALVVGREVDRRRLAKPA